jgi:hypothetical protein
MVQLHRGSISTSALTVLFLEEAGTASTLEEWMDAVDVGDNPVDWLESLEAISFLPNETAVLPSVFRNVVSMCLRAPQSEATGERADRLPLGRATSEAWSLLEESPATFMEHVFDRWIFGQHTYWSVGRGLADARGRGKRILRLKVVLEENGWTLTPGTKSNPASHPRTTADRLGTVLSLMSEAGLPQ